MGLVPIQPLGSGHPKGIHLRIRWVQTRDFSARFQWETWNLLLERQSSVPRGCGNAGAARFRCANRLSVVYRIRAAQMKAKLVIREWEKGSW